MTTVVKQLMKERFRGYLPVIVDIETAGFDAKKHPLLEIAAVIVEYDDNEELVITESHSAHIIPFENSILDPAALKFTGIDPYHPFRMAITEKEALGKLFTPIKNAVKRNECTRAILVGHNPTVDIYFSKDSSCFQRLTILQKISAVCFASYSAE